MANGSTMSWLSLKSADFGSLVIDAIEAVDARHCHENQPFVSRANKSCLRMQIFSIATQGRRGSTSENNQPGDNLWAPKFSDCIEACNVAWRWCERLVTGCMAQPDVNTVTQVIVVARDVARIATLTSQLLERGSKYSYPICGVCAAACAELAKAAKIPEDRSFLSLRRSLS
jgi:hypothetical protein